MKLKKRPFKIDVAKSCGKGLAIEETYVVTHRLTVPATSSIVVAMSIGPAGPITGAMVHTQSIIRIT